jgi:hypothetical protein
MVGDEATFVRPLAMILAIGSSRRPVGADQEVGHPPLPFRREVAIASQDGEI